VGKSIQADWSRTQAFNGYAHGGIFLNTRASNPEGIVAENEIAGLSDQIIDSLESDEYLGPRIEGLYNRNDIFTGEHVNKLPHVILKFKDGYIGSTGYGEKISRGAEELRSNGKTIGFHTMAGLFLASGGKIRSTGISGLSIMDLAPTVLHYFEEPVPEHYDGTVITEMFKTDSDTAARPIEKSRIKFDKEGREQSAEDISKIEERLQDMGYM
jgi:predicted AlkP superfamily phosphohydrolase/phosphomutase